MLLRHRLLEVDFLVHPPLPVSKPCLIYGAYIHWASTEFQVLAQLIYMQHFWVYIFLFNHCVVLSRVNSLIPSFELKPQPVVACSGLQLQLRLLPGGCLDLQFPLQRRVLVCLAPQHLPRTRRVLPLLQQLRHQH